MTAVTMGFHKCKLTPKLPVLLGGFRAHREATKVHDDLYGRCVIFEKGEERFGFIQLDWLAVDDLFLKRLENQLAELHLPLEHLFVTAIHTHSGPAGVTDTFGMTDVFGEPNLSYLDWCAEQIKEACEIALANQQTFTISVGHSQVEQVGTERNDPSRKGDKSLLYLELTREDGKTVMIYNYACHPTVLGPGNLEITKDLPSGVDEKWPADLVLFWNSCCGDISTRFTRESSTFSQIDIYTERLMEALHKAEQTKKALGLCHSLQIKQYVKMFPCKELPSLEEAKAYVAECEKALQEAKEQGIEGQALRLIQTKQEGAVTALTLVKGLGDRKKFPIKITLLEMQGLKIIGISGELFSTLGVPLKEQGIEVVAYTNGYSLYIADTKAYETGVYEALSSPFAKGVGERLLEEIQTIMQG